MNCLHQLTVTQLLISRRVDKYQCLVGTRSSALSGIMGIACLWAQCGVNDQMDQ